jgi:peptidoglycan/LPS O-acetylase OafA/YrhL
MALKKHVPALDGVRGLAIVLVLAHHWLVLDWPGSPGSLTAFFQSLLGLSWAGVDLFFVLSGFLIGGILLDHRASPRYYQVFWVRRFFRIAPVFALFFGVFCLFSEQWHLWSRSSAPLWVHAAFLTNFWIAKVNFWDSSYLTLIWTLAVEEQVYLILPFVVRHCSRTALLRISLAALVVAPALRTLIFLHRPSATQLASHVLMPCRADAFAVGLLVALAVRREIPFLKTARERMVFYLIGAGLAAGLIILNALDSKFGTLAMCLVGYSLIALSAGWLIAGAITFPDGWLSRSLCHPALRALGLGSYFIYLFHRLIAAAVTAALVALDSPPLWQPLLVTLLASVITFGTAAISYKFFEHPLVAIGHRVRY